MFLIESKEDLKGKKLNDFVRGDIHYLITISDELFKELTGKEPVVKLQEDWREYERCPACGEYIFIYKIKENSFITISPEIGIERVQNITPIKISIKCKCGAKLEIRD